MKLFFCLSPHNANIHIFKLKSDNKMYYSRNSQSIKFGRLKMEKHANSFANRGAFVLVLTKSTNEKVFFNTTHLFKGLTYKISSN